MRKLSAIAAFAASICSTTAMAQFYGPQLGMTSEDVVALLACATLLSGGGGYGASEGRRDSSDYGEYDSSESEQGSLEENDVESGSGRAQLVSTGGTLNESSGFSVLLQKTRESSRALPAMTANVPAQRLHIERYRRSGDTSGDMALSLESLGE